MSILESTNIDKLAALVEKVSAPNGWDWMFPLRVVPVDGKPTIVSHRGGNLFRGYIATWDEADLLVALANLAPQIVTALNAAEFLSDRLDQLEWMDDDLKATLRDYMGHVDPAHDRLRSAVIAAKGDDHD